MFKNTQFKIMLIFFIIGILIISGLGIFFLKSINTVEVRNTKWTNTRFRTSNSKC